MKRKRFSVEQIVVIVKQMGMPLAELIRRVGISEQAFSAGRSHPAAA